MALLMKLYPSWNSFQQLNPKYFPLQEYSDALSLPLKEIDLKLKIPLNLRALIIVTLSLTQNISIIKSMAAILI